MSVCRGNFGVFQDGLEGRRRGKKPGEEVVLPLLLLVEDTDARRHSREGKRIVGGSTKVAGKKKR